MTPCMLQNLEGTRVGLRSAVPACWTSPCLALVGVVVEGLAVLACAQAVHQLAQLSDAKTDGLQGRSTSVGGR